LRRKNRSKTIFIDFFRWETEFLDIPTINENVNNLVRKYEGKYIFECAKMYHGQPPNCPINLVYGITSFELG
jgi:hypothetical protein